MGRIVGFSSNHTRVQVVSVGASGLINFDHTTLFAPFLRSEEYPSSTFSALRSVHDAASNKIPLVIKYPFDQNVTRDSMYAFGQNGPSSCNSTARAGKRPWNPKEPKMIARKQLLTIALILGCLGLIGVFAISTNTSGIIFLPR